MPIQIALDTTFVVGMIDAQDIWHGRSTILKPSLESKETIEKLLASSDKVDSLHKAAILLKDLDGVECFI